MRPSDQYTDNTTQDHWLPATEVQQLRLAKDWGINVPVTSAGVSSVDVVHPTRSVRARQLSTRPRPPRPAVKDANGLDLRPDPQQARTAAELVAALQEFREWAGEPSFETMADQCGQMVSKSTLYRTLNRRALPRLEAVMAVIIGCGGSEEDTRRFASAWRTVRSANRRPATSSPPPRCCTQSGAPDEMTPRVAQAV